MQSEVMGPMEKAAQSMIVRLRAPYAAGTTAQFDPETCKDFSDALELMAQCADERAASLREAHLHAARTLVWTVVSMVLCVLLVVALLV
jgi:hypothetical protein